MKYLGKAVVCLASGLVLSTGLCADNRASAGDPYEPIVTRNIFGLNPPQPHAVKEPEPPSKITPDGIMTIFGSPQVLFNVEVPPHPPTPATQKSYILSQGQQQDDIEVLHIDEKSGLVTFNNHGVVQKIPLAKAPPITTPTPVVMRSNRVARSGFHPPPKPAQKQLSPEEQMIMIAAEHAEAQKEGNPIAKIFPPTPLDQAAGVTSPSAQPKP
jgi:hypothetical protein